MANTTAAVPVYPEKPTYRIPNLTVAQINESIKCMENREV